MRLRKRSWVLAVVVLASLVQLPAQAQTSTVRRQRTVWYLGEGATHSGFQTFVDIVNVGDGVADVEVDFLTERGGQVFGGPRLKMPANTRETVKMNDYLASDNATTRVRTFETSQAITGVVDGFVGKDVTVHGSITRVDPASGKTLIGTSMRAITVPSTQWYFSQGASHSGFGTYINVTDASGSAGHSYTLKVLTEHQGIQTFNRTFGFANQRETLPVHEMMAQAGFDPDNFGVEVFSNDDKPLVVFGTMERFQPAVGFVPADFVHSSAAAVPSPATTWQLAEADTHSNFGSYVLITNHGRDVANAQVILTSASGLGSLAQVFQIEPSQRLTVPVRTMLAGLLGPTSDAVNNGNFGVTVNSLSGARGPQGLVVYGSTDRVSTKGAALDFSAGVPSTNQSWMSAGGATHSGISTFVQISNPSGGTTFYSIHAIRGGKSDPLITRKELGGRRRDTVLIDRFIEAENVSLQVFVPNDPPASAIGSPTPAGPPIVVEMTTNRGEEAPAPGYYVARHDFTPSALNGNPIRPPGSGDTPGGVTATESGTGQAPAITVEWNETPGATGGFHIYRAEVGSTGDGPYRRITFQPYPQNSTNCDIAPAMPVGTGGVNPERCRFVDRGQDIDGDGDIDFLRPGTTYKYQVTSLNVHLLEGARSAPAQATTDAAPSPSPSASPA